jgi:small subunit ribosomal protein S6
LLRGFFRGAVKTKKEVNGCMNKYESMYILKPNIEDEQRNELIKKFSDIIENNGGKVEKTDEWGKKKLAYPIEYISDGYYVLVDFEGPGELPSEMERNFKISDDVLRYMVIRREA